MLQKRYSTGLQYQVAYTYSKCTTDNSGYYGTWGSTQATPANPYYQNLYNPKADWADCYFDATHVVSAYAVYDLPFGKGKRFGSNMNSVANAVVGNWSINPIVSLHTGFPLALYDSAAIRLELVRVVCGPIAVTEQDGRSAGATQSIQQRVPTPAISTSTRLRIRRPPSALSETVQHKVLWWTGICSGFESAKGLPRHGVHEIPIPGGLHNAFNRVNLNAPSAHWVEIWA